MYESHVEQYNKCINKKNNIFYNIIIDDNYCGICKKYGERIWYDQTVINISPQILFCVRENFVFYSFAIDDGKI